MNLNLERRRAAGVQLPDGRVWVTGGRLSDNTITDTTEFLEPTPGSMFKSGPLLPNEAEFHCILMVTDRYILYAGKFLKQKLHYSNHCVTLKCN